MQRLQHIIKLLWNLAFIIAMFVFLGYWSRAHPYAMIFGLVAFWCLTFGSMRLRAFKAKRKQRA